jgi:hypothetical protein
LKQIGIDVDVNGVIERSRRTFSETENDILRRLLLRQPTLPRTQSQPPTRAPKETGASTRVHGQWMVEFRGQRHSAPNLKGAYRALLLTLSDAFPDFLQRFAQEKSRSRRFVSRVPAELYLSTPELADDYAEPLRDGWYFDTNLSAQQVAKRARVAARVAGLLYGRDVRILNKFEEI